MAQQQFLPYVTSAEIEDSYMKRVSVTNAEIGSRPSNMPESMRNSNSIEHVGGTNGSTKSSSKSKV